MARIASGFIPTSLTLCTGHWGPLWPCQAMLPTSDARNNQSDVGQLADDIAVEMLSNGLQRPKIAFNLMATLARTGSLNPPRSQQTNASIHAYFLPASACFYTGGKRFSHREWDRLRGMRWGWGGM
ncbi:hypothetical protein PG989_012093 [Apiospora arundinis]